MIDSKSGEVYFEKAADSPFQPASLTKLMTMLMVFERLKDGRLSLDDPFTVSEEAWRRGGAPSGSSTMYAEPNSTVKLEDLIKGVVVQSANDAAIAIAEGLAGSEDAFARQMTKRARDLGLKTSTFRNATGLPDPDHVMTAHELAQLTRYLIEVFPEYYTYYAQPEFTWNNIAQKSRNPLLGSYPGADGVSTGFLRDSGYNFIGSAKRDGRRYIVVLGGLPSARERAREARRLLDWGFQRYKTVTLYKQGEAVAHARIWGGKSSWVPVRLRQDIKLLLSDKERARIKAEVIYKGPLKAPIEKGERIGAIRVLFKGRVLSKRPVYAGESIVAGEKLWRKAYDSLAFMLFGG